MSDLFVDNIKHQSSQGSGTITLGTSGEKITTASGAEFSAVTGHMYPAFFAYDLHTTEQSLSASTATKLTPATEYYDTDNAYSSDKFTVPTGKAGKYRFYGGAEMKNNSGVGFCMLYVNGSVLLDTSGVFTSLTSRFNAGTGSSSEETFCGIDFVVDLSESDYVELYMLIVNAGSVRKIQFGGYRLGA